MSRANQFVQYFLSHRNVAIELIGKIDQSHYDFKPTPTSMSAKQLASHILQSFYQFANTAKSGDPAAFSRKLDVETADLNELAEVYTKETVTLLESLTDDEFERIIDLTKIFGAKMSGAQLLQTAMDHEIHHKGQLFVYVREMGHTDLPLFVKRG